MQRRILPFILEDLRSKKMVFIGGPRQVGKTTLSLDIMKHFKKPIYLNFDHPEDRIHIQKRNWKKENDLLVFDEIHKWKNWKSWIKGIHDKEKDDHSILITGSARLDVYRKGGDSLQGRYHYYRLNPFTYSEIFPQDKKITLDALYKQGGFPEPLLHLSNRNIKRWKKERMERVVREDIYSLESLKNLYQLELLVDLLKERVGSPLSIKGLSEDLSVAPATVEHWIRILESMYVLFIVRPYHKKLNRAIKKEYKIYFFDWTESSDEGARLENMVALHLLNYCYFLEDTEGEKMALHFVRDRDSHEVDFLVLQNNKPHFLLEVKKSDSHPTNSLLYFSKKILPQKTIQLVYEISKEVLNREAFILPIQDFFLDI